MIEDLNAKEREVFLELLRNAKVSDRELANKLNSSQPTITRIRSKLQTQGFIEKYSILPSMGKAGLDLIVFSFIRDIDSAAKKALKDWLHENKAVVFAADGEGLREYTLLVSSIHSDFHAYEEFLNALREKFEKKIGSISPFLISRKQIIKQFDLGQPVAEKVLKAPKQSKRIRRFLRLPRELPSIPRPTLPSLRRKKKNSFE